MLPVNRRTPNTTIIISQIDLVTGIVVFETSLIEGVNIRKISNRFLSFLLFGKEECLLCFSSPEKSSYQSKTSGGRFPDERPYMSVTRRRVSYLWKSARGDAHLTFVGGEGKSDQPLDTHTIQQQMTVVEMRPPYSHINPPLVTGTTKVGVCVD